MIPLLICAGIIGIPTGAGPPTLLIPAKVTVCPLARFRFVFNSRAVGSNLLLWHMQNNLFPPSSVPPGAQLSSVKLLLTSCHPGMQQRCGHLPNVIMTPSLGINLESVCA